MLVSTMKSLPGRSRCPPVGPPNEWHLATSEDSTEVGNFRSLRHFRLFDLGFSVRNVVGLPAQLVQQWFR